MMLSNIDLLVKQVTVCPFSITVTVLTMILYCRWFTGASPLIRDMLTVDPLKRADIAYICDNS